MFIFKNTIIVGISCAKIVHSNELFWLFTLSDMKI